MGRCAASADFAGKSCRGGKKGIRALCDKEKGTVFAPRREAHVGPGGAAPSEVLSAYDTATFWINLSLINYY